MKTSGHSNTFIRNVAVKGIMAYEQKVKRSLLEKSNPAYMPLYMGSFNSRGRAKQKAQKKSNRFKNKAQEQGSPPTMSNDKFVSKKRKPVLKA